MFVYPDWPAPKRVKAVMTTREGGMSAKPYASLNLGDHVDDCPQAVTKNRALLHETLQLPAEPIWLSQVHGTTVLKHAVAQSGDEADAIVATQAGQVCAIMTADCLPVLFCDRTGTVVGGAHAGWRGLAAGVLGNTIDTMGCSPDQILVWLGAAIGPSAFEVGDDVRDAFLAQDDKCGQAFKAYQTGKWMADIYQLATRNLVRNGILQENIYGAHWCTFTQAEQFYSYRRESQTGRMASLIWLD